MGRRDRSVLHRVCEGACEVDFVGGGVKACGADRAGGFLFAEVRCRAIRKEHDAGGCDTQFV